MTIQFVAVDNEQKKRESSNYSNCQFLLAYENYVSVFILSLYISSEEKDKLV